MEYCSKKHVILDVRQQINLPLAQLYEMKAAFNQHRQGLAALNRAINGRDNMAIRREILVHYEYLRLIYKLAVDEVGADRREVDGRM